MKRGAFMKKLINLFLVFVFCLALLCGCGSNEGSSSLSSQNSSAVDSNSGQNKDDTALLKDETGITDGADNKDSTEKPPNYYPFVKNATYKEDYIEFYKTKGQYFKIISSYEEAQKILVSPYIDQAIFKENYILCITATGTGYYGFNCENGQYSISADRYCKPATEPTPDIQEIFSKQSLSFIVVPKSEVKYFEGYREINITANITDEAFDVPFAPTIEVTVNVGMTDAILIAQNHFFNTFAKGLPDGYIYSSKYNRDNERYWYISLFDKGINENYTENFDDFYTYLIDKSTGEIREINITDKTPIDYEEATDIAKKYMLASYPEQSSDTVLKILPNDFSSTQWYVYVVTETDTYVICIDKFSKEVVNTFTYG